MFNIGKILLFVVTMITSAALLFVIPHIHIQIDWTTLVTHHRIKVALTLLSPVIFGAITAYIAYQQHRLAKTQANISKDQRDIAYDKMRLEHNERLIAIFNKMAEVYRALYDLECYCPNDLKNDIRYSRAWTVEELSRNTQVIPKSKKWALGYLKKSKKISKLLDVCWINQQECKFMLDRKTYQSIFDFGNKARALFDTKKECLDSQIRHNELSYNDILRKINKELDDLMDKVTEGMGPYMDIRDIISPRKFGE